MSTNFMSLIDETKVVKETVFTSFVDFDLKNRGTIGKPCDYRNVLHIGFDKEYRDVFKCWNDNEKEFTIYFGTKGDEFNK